MEQPDAFTTEPMPDGDAWQPVTLGGWRERQRREMAKARAAAIAMVNAKFDEIEANQVVAFARAERDMHPTNH